MTIFAFNKIEGQILGTSNFLGRLAELVPETKTECFAWARIPNPFVV